MTKRERKWMERVRDIGCLVCKLNGFDDTPAQIHHLFAPRERSDWLICPLCEHHHTGKNGFHGLGGAGPFTARYGLTEAQMLGIVIERLA